MPRPIRFKPRRTRCGFPLLLALPLAGLAGVIAVEGPPEGLAFAFPRPAVLRPDREVAHFSLCSGAIRQTCVIDGDTFWYRGEKVRIADINAPEVGDPGCAAEAALGARATDRLAALLNAGPFTLAPGDPARDRDRYGRLLREVTRDGESLGDAMVAEGLAETWRGYRRDWCGG